jgi:hypothetical protein
MHVKLALWVAGLPHFLVRSRDQLRAHVLIYHHLWPPLLHQMQRQQSPLRAAACNLDSFLCLQLVWQVAFQELIPLGEHKTPDHQAGAYTRYLSGSPEAN